MSALGSFTPGLSFASFGSFHLVMVPRKMPGKTLGAELERLGDARKVVRGYHGAQYRGKVESLRRQLGDLVVGHRHVGCAEIHGSRGKLRDARPGPEGLVIDGDAGVGCVVFTEPLLVDRRGKRRAGSVDILCGGAGSARQQTWRQARTMICSYVFS